MVHYEAKVEGGRLNAEDLGQMLPRAADVPPGLAMAEDRDILPGE